MATSPTALDTKPSKNSLFSFNFPSIRPPPLHIPESPPLSNTDSAPPTPSDFTIDSRNTSPLPHSVESSPCIITPVDKLPASLPSLQYTWHPQSSLQTLHGDISRLGVLSLDQRMMRLRFNPSREFALGKGRYSTVYLGSYLPDLKSSTEIYGEYEDEWMFCAVKHIRGEDLETKQAATGECTILNHLSLPNPKLSRNPSRFIISLLGVNTPEYDFTPSIEPMPQDSIALGLKRKKSVLSLTSLAERYGESPPPSPTPTNSRSTLPAILGRVRVKRFLTTKSHEREKSSSSNSEPTISRNQSLGRSRYQWDPTNPGIVIVTEYCPLGSLRSFLSSSPELIWLDRWFEWALQLADAVDWIHENNILHADIKTENVLIGADGSLRLSDFGMAIVLPLASFPPLLNPLGLGTPTYIPPEFLVNHSCLSLSSDIFSFGILLNVMLTAQEPYEGMRSMERIWWVREGNYWGWAENRRILEAGIRRRVHSRDSSLSTSLVVPEIQAISLNDSELDAEKAHDPPSNYTKRYPDGSLVMYIGREVVPYHIRELIMKMTCAVSEERVNAKMVVSALEV